jgi:hypothetical protein
MDFTRNVTTAVVYPQVGSDAAATWTAPYARARVIGNMDVAVCEAVPIMMAPPPPPAPAFAPAQYQAHTTIRAEDLVSGPEGPDKVVSNQHPVALIDQKFVTASTSTLKFKMARMKLSGNVICDIFSSKAKILASISDLSIRLSRIFTFIQGWSTMQTEI